MNETQLTAMRAGKAQADERKRQQHAQQVTVYRAWLSAESRAYTRMTLTRYKYGVESSAFADAAKAWRSWWRAKPACPPDSSEAWR